MGDIISIGTIYADSINLEALKSSSRALRQGLISPPTEEVAKDIVKEHDAEPIKSLEDINRISAFLKDEGRYRDNMLFIVGINFGLRVSDLRKLKFSDLIDETYSFKVSFPVWETKTRNTRRSKRNRYITINRAVMEAVTLYLEHTPDVRLSDYMFRSESNNGSNLNEPIHRNSIDRILKGIAKDLGLGIRMSTHTLRKTFGYHQMVMSGNDHRKLLLLQKMFGHSSAAQTLDYIGITEEEIQDAYRNLNLGSDAVYSLVDSAIMESAS